LLTGHLDTLLTSGHIEGWALDREQPGALVEITTLFEGTLIARGVACRYRRDLADAGLGWGWNAFRLSLQSWPALSPAKPILDLMTGSQRLWRGPVAWRDDVKHQYTTVQQLIAQDPTQVRNPQLLEGMREHLTKVRGTLGDDGFIRRCYLAIFGRQADLSGLAEYKMQLQTGELQAYDVVAAMMRGAEFLAGNRGVQPPTLASFPFALVEYANTPAEPDDLLSGACLSGAGPL